MWSSGGKNEKDNTSLRLFTFSKADRQGNKVPTHTNVAPSDPSQSTNTSRANDQQNISKHDQTLLKYQNP